MKTGRIPHQIQYLVSSVGKITAEIIHRKKLLVLLLFLFVLQNAFSKNYYIAPNGSSSNPGTFDKPFAKVIDFGNIANPGDTCYVRGGTYYREDLFINVTRSGTKENSIVLMNYPGEEPIIDGSQVVTEKRRGLLRLYKTRWWYIKGLAFANGNSEWTAGMALRDCENVTIEECKFYNNKFTGLHMDGVKAKNIRVINCDSYNNIDGDYQDADGFQVWAQNLDNSVVFIGCRAWNNADDGWDLYGAAQNSVVIKNCWSFRNGYKGTHIPLGDGTGFKLGGSTQNAYVSTTGGHRVENCVAWSNKAIGFNENANEQAPDTLYNCIAFDNRGWAEFDFDAGKNNAYNVVHVLRNCVAYANFNGVAVEGSDNQNNDWNISSITVTANDFLSNDDTGADGPRQAEGSLPDIDFLKLKSSSALVDAGTDVGLPFNGSAPDLGAFETDVHSTAVIDNSTYAYQVVLYPNPVHDKVFIPKEFVNDNYQITSLDGKVIRTGCLSSSIINLSKLSTGIFFFKIIDRRTRSSKVYKLMKK